MLKKAYELGKKKAFEKLGISLERILPLFNKHYARHFDMTLGKTPLVKKPKIPGSWSFRGLQDAMQAHYSKLGPKDSSLLKNFMVPNMERASGNVRDLSPEGRSFLKEFLRRNYTVGELKPEIASDLIPIARNMSPLSDSAAGQAKYTLGQYKKNLQNAGYLSPRAGKRTYLDPVREARRQQYKRTGN